MSLQDNPGSHRWIGPLLRLAGLAIFVLAFFAAAVLHEDRTYSGWKCASVATTMVMTMCSKPGDHYEPFQFMVAMSGLINPLVLLTLLASPVRALRILRLVFGGAIAICMVATWVLFAQQHIAPLIGHFMWIAGALLIVIPDLLPRGQRQRLA